MSDAVAVMLLLRDFTPLEEKAVDARNISLRHKGEQAEIAATQLLVPMAVCALVIGTSHLRCNIAYITIETAEKFCQLGNSQKDDDDGKQDKQNGSGAIIFHSALRSFL